jgi:histidyl-tRNA synthetase
MANKPKFQAIKGTRDLLPPDTELWNRVETTAREVFSTYGYGEIRPPIFESTELFARAVGGETDIVSKEMYSFEDFEFDQITALRTLLIAKQPSITGPNFFLSYELKVAEFRERLARALDAGEIAKTPENIKALSGLGPLLDSLSSDRQDYERTKNPGIFERFNLYVGMIRNQLIAVGLGDNLSLRPEATASICRAYIEHNMNTLPQPVKLYCLGPMFRRERPQKGRYRQFYQIDAEVLGGNDAPGIDAEVIEMVMTLFARLKLGGLQLEINSIGHSGPPVDGKPVCRRAYVEKLRAALMEVKDQLGEDSRRRIETNPLRALDSKLEHEQPIIATLPSIGDYLCDDCAKHYAEVKRQLDIRGVKYRENWRLVRGLDYYMRTTFEITAQGLGSQNAVCGGGRYDGLVELLGGPPTKGIGFAIGEDRLILSLQEAGKGGVTQGRDVYIAWMGAKTQETAIAVAQKLRAAGLRVELPPVEQKFGKALGQAAKLGSRYAVILGDDEVASGQWTLKTLAGGTQKKYSEGELVDFLKSENTALRG